MAKKSLIEKWKRTPKFKVRAYTRCHRCGRAVQAPQATPNPGRKRTLGASDGVEDDDAGITRDAEFGERLDWLLVRGIAVHFGSHAGPEMQASGTVGEIPLEIESREKCADSGPETRKPAAPFEATGLCSVEGRCSGNHVPARPTCG